MFVMPSVQPGEPSFNRPTPGCTWPTGDTEVRSGEAMPAGSAGYGRTTVIGGGQTMKGLRIGVMLFAILVLSGCASIEGPGSGQRMPRPSPGMDSNGDNGGMGGKGGY